MAKEFARRCGLCCRLYYACTIVPCPFRHAVASKGCTKIRTIFFNSAMAAAIDDLAFELCWSFDRSARRRQAVRTWHKRGHKTRLSKCTCACCGELFYRGFCKFPRFCRVCASLLCPAIVSIFGVSIRVRPLFFWRAHYFRVPTNSPPIFRRMPTIFRCPLFFWECSDFRSESAR